VNLPGSSILDLLHVYSALRRGNQHDDFRTAIGGIPNETTILPRVNDPNLTLVYTKETDTFYAASTVPRKIPLLYCKLIRINGLVSRMLISCRFGQLLCASSCAEQGSPLLPQSQNMQVSAHPRDASPAGISLNSRSFSVISKNAEAAGGAFHRNCGGVSLRSFKLE